MGKNMIPLIIFASIIFFALASNINTKNPHISFPLNSKDNNDKPLVYISTQPHGIKKYIAVFLMGDENIINKITKNLTIPYEVVDNEYVVQCFGDDCTNLIQNKSVKFVITKGKNIGDLIKLSYVNDFFVIVIDNTSPKIIKPIVENVTIPTIVLKTEVMNIRNNEDIAEVSGKIYTMAMNYTENYYIVILNITPENDIKIEKLIETLNLLGSINMKNNISLYDYFRIYRTSVIMGNIIQKAVTISGDDSKLTLSIKLHNIPVGTQIYVKKVITKDDVKNFVSNITKDKYTYYTFISSGKLKYYDDGDYIVFYRSDGVGDINLQVVYLPNSTS